MVGLDRWALGDSTYTNKTISVLWNNHSLQLGEKGRWGKYALWERATWVKLLWVAPGITTPGSTTNKPVNLLDIYPALTALTGCKPPERQLEGKDLTVLMKNPKASWVKTSLTVLATITTAFDPNATATSLTPTAPKNSIITRKIAGNGSQNNQNNQNAPRLRRPCAKNFPLTTKLPASPM